MSAIRLARGYTGKDKIIKFAGCYHGHVDSLLVKAVQVLTLGNPMVQVSRKALLKKQSSCLSMIQKQSNKHLNHNQIKWQPSLWSHFPQIAGLFFFTRIP